MLQIWIIKWMPDKLNLHGFIYLPSVGEVEQNKIKWINIYINWLEKGCLAGQAPACLAYMHLSCRIWKISYYPTAFSYGWRKIETKSLVTSGWQVNSINKANHISLPENSIGEAEWAWMKEINYPQPTSRHQSGDQYNQKGKKATRHKKSGYSIKVGKTMCQLNFKLSKVSSTFWCKSSFYMYWRFCWCEADSLGSSPSPKISTYLRITKLNASKFLQNLLWLCVSTATSG